MYSAILNVSQIWSPNSERAKTEARQSYIFFIMNNNFTYKLRWKSNVCIRTVLSTCIILTSAYTEILVSIMTFYIDFKPWFSALSRSPCRTVKAEKLLLIKRWIILKSRSISIVLASNMRLSNLLWYSEIVGLRIFLSYQFLCKNEESQRLVALRAPA